MSCVTTAENEVAFTAADPLNATNALMPPPSLYDRWESQLLRSISCSRSLILISS